MNFWKMILPTALRVINWFIKRKLASSTAERSFINFVEKRSAKQRTSKRLSDEYWHQFEDLKESRERRTKYEKKFKKRGYMRGHLCLVIGHEKKSPGAMGAHPLNMSEWEYNNKLAIEIVRIGENRGHSVDTYLRDHIGIEKVYENVVNTRPNAIIELHFNAFDGRVQGTEVLYSDIHDHSGTREKILALKTQEAMCRALKRTSKQDRGLKIIASEGERGFLNVSQTNDIPSILIEPFFGDNTHEAQLAVSRMDDIAESIIDAFEAFLA